MSAIQRFAFLIVAILLLHASVEADEFFRDDTKEVVLDKGRNLMWQDDSTASSTDKSYADAIAHCQDLNFAGYADWYLPSVDELKSIVKAENYPRSIAKEFQNVYADYYWSSTQHSSEYAWIVLFIYEDVVHFHKTDPSHVRCVRKVQ